MQPFAMLKQGMLEENLAQNLRIRIPPHDPDARSYRKAIERLKKER